MNWVNLINKKVQIESKGHPHSKEEKANLFHTFDFSSTEIETLNFLHSLVLLLKPVLVLETGSFYGYGSIALGSALKENKRGRLITLEKDTEVFKIAKNNISKANLIDYVDVLNATSLDYIKSTTSRFDLVFFDSSINSRISEFTSLYNKKLLTNIVVFHDTSELRERTLKSGKYTQYEYTKDLDNIAQNYCKGSITFSLSRGLKLFQLK